MLLRVCFATSPPAQKPLGKGIAFIRVWVKSLFFLLILLYFCIRIFTHKQIKTVMQNLRIHNSHFITFTDPLFTIDVLGGVDLSQVERLVCTLRITYQCYPPFRTTLDLYSNPQTDKLLRTLCDK